MGLTVEHKNLRSIMIENGIDPDTILSFLEDKIAESRETDEACKSSLGKAEFYSREKRYTDIESFILHLK
jgi:hypothetical protein